MIIKFYFRTINLMKDREFIGSNKIFSGVLKKMRREGLDTTAHKSAISEEDMKLLYIRGRCLTLRSLGDYYIRFISKFVFILPGAQLTISRVGNVVGTLCWTLYWRCPQRCEHVQMESTKNVAATLYTTFPQLSHNITTTLCITFPQHCYNFRILNLDFLFHTNPANIKMCI